MCKNEHVRISVTLQSVAGYVSSLIVYDTGSEDNTIDILRKFTTDNGIPLRLKCGSFEDFATSRNVALDFADEFLDVDFLLLIDVNDELQCGNDLVEFCKSVKNDSEKTAFYVRQHWWSGKHNKYFNVRLVKPRCGWRYKGAVHEWITQLDESRPKNISRAPESVVLYQDRTQDDDKSSKRFARDKELLLRDHMKEPEEPRTLFYLAQTCSCLGEPEEALNYYSQRAELQGFYEERFHACLRAGEMAKECGRPWMESLNWFLRAYGMLSRVEPLVCLTQHYIETKEWKTAYLFIVQAVRLSFPQECSLFIDNEMYEYTRFHFLGIVGWYAEEYEDGEKGCRKAIEMRPSSEVDQNNLKFYTDRKDGLVKTRPIVSVPVQKVGGSRVCRGKKGRKRR